MTHLRPICNPADADALMGLRRSLRVAKVAEALDMEDAQVRKLVKSGDLEGHRVGKRGIRVYEDSVEAYRRRNHIGPNQVPQPETKRQQRRSGPTAAAREAMAHLRSLGVF